VLSMGFGAAIHPGGIRVLMRSRYGPALIAVRDDEMAASPNGIANGGANGRSIPLHCSGF